ncbi:response regulator transcription factor [Pseudoalteromonas sp. HL-AS1]|uniref:response regulator transcription factor n=1 Tax=Pseudoalteromonas sp. HL-AS1 TaxID=3071081 RepID=UPI002815684A|nr:response regulator transcription factor [Pseudoalteromonas sp. HL-AS1]WMS92284.1 response regulator transcription factor [Pseudoalteromonas sp. HL-AS1]
MSIRILYVEDDKNFAATVLEFLELMGLICDYADNGLQGVTLAKKNQYDVIVTDITMPKLDGRQMCQELRLQGIDTPILMLSALHELDDKLAGFDCGADDYLTKPFELKELVARIKTLSKRRSGNAQKLVIKDLALELNLGEHLAFREGVQLKLTPSGWKILEVIARAYPNCVDRQMLEHVIWGDDIPDSEALKVHIHRLRQRVDKPFSEPLLHIVNGGAVLKRANL